MIRHGNVLRTHDGELFHYGTGVWENVKDPPHLDMQNVGTITEGLFHQLAEGVEAHDTWDWDTVSQSLSNVIASNGNDTLDPFTKRMVKTAKQAWDVNKKSTKGGVYNAAPLCKSGDSVALQGKEFHDNDLSKVTKSKLLRM